MIRQLFKGRFLGHPVHPMLVHFPTALFMAALGFDLYSMTAPDVPLDAASFWCTGMGLAAGVLAAVFGAVDLAKLESGNAAFSTALWHGMIQGTVLMGMGVIFGLRLMRYPEVMASTGEIIAAGLVVLLMLAGNYLGGELVFRHRVGVEK